MSSRLSTDEVQSLRSILAELSADPSKFDGDVGADAIALLEKSRRTAFSEHPAIAAILEQPRTPVATGIAADPRVAAGYSDTGYNDVQDPQPGGGY